MRAKADGGVTSNLPLRAQLLTAAGSLMQTCDIWGYYLAQATGIAAPKPDQFNTCAVSRDVPVSLGRVAETSMLTRE